MKNPPKIRYIGVILTALIASQQSEAASDEMIIEEVIVTATKREVSIQDVPQSISAMTGATLAENLFDDLQDYGKAIPAFQYQDLGPTNNRVTVRGVSSQSQGGLTSLDTVTIYQDETPLAGSPFNQPDVKTFDIERVEILKGPQGTLYGEGSMGGTVRMITNKPNTQETEFIFDSSLYATARSGDLSTVANVAVNVPIIKDKLAFRLTGTYRDEAGYIDNTYYGTDDVNSQDGYSLRGQILFDPTEKLSLLFAGQTNSLDASGSFSAFSDFTHDDIVEEKVEQTQDIAAFTLTYDFAPLQLVSNTSTYSATTKGMAPLFAGLGFIGAPGVIDNGTITDVAEALGVSITEALDASLAQSVDFDQFSHETRFVSTWDRSWNFTFGVFYKESDRDIIQIADTYLSTASDLQAVLGDPTGSYQHVEFALTDKQWAVFGEVDFALSDTLTLTLGGRYFEQDYEFNTRQWGGTAAAFAGGIPVFLTEPFAFEFLGTPSTADVFSPKVTLAWAPTDNAMYYFTRSEGFRGGGLNSPLAAAFGAPAEYGPETMINYELGAKTTQMDGAMTLNGSIFYMDWQDKQVANFSPFGSFQTNVGSAHVFGIEGEVSYYAYEGLTLSLNGSWLEAEIDEDTPTGASKGNRLPMTPEFQFFASARYDWTVGSNNRANVSASFGWQDEREWLINNIPGQQMESFATVDLIAGLDTDKWTFSLFCRNCSNEDGYSTVFNAFVPQDQWRHYFVRPRTIGIRVSYSM